MFSRSCYGHSCSVASASSPVIFTYTSYLSILSLMDTQVVSNSPTSLTALQQTEVQGFPGGSVVKNLPANARDLGSIPDPGGCYRSQSSWARAPQLLSLCSRAQEHQNTAAHMPTARALQQEEPPQWEARAPQLERSPHSPQLDKSLCDNKDPVQPKINKIMKKKTEVQRS